MTGPATSDVGCNDAGKVLNNTMLIKIPLKFHLQMTNVAQMEIEFNQNSTFSLLQKYTKTAKPAIIYGMK